MERKIICPKYLWDGISDTARENCALVIEDGTVEKIVSADETALTAYRDVSVLRNERWPVEAGQLRNPALCAKFLQRTKSRCLSG